LEPYVGRSEIVPEFQRYPGNDTLRELLFGFLVVTINAGFICCYDPSEEVVVVSDFIQQFLSN
jgi:hypothetical protein